MKYFIVQKTEDVVFVQNENKVRITKRRSHVHFIDLVTIIKTLLIPLTP